MQRIPGQKESLDFLFFDPYIKGLDLDYLRNKLGSI